MKIFSFRSEHKAPLALIGFLFGIVGSILLVCLNLSFLNLEFSLVGTPTTFGSAELITLGLLGSGLHLALQIIVKQTLRIFNAAIHMSPEM